MRIACLHAAESNIASFEAASAGLGLAAGTLQHEVRPDLLAAAEQAGSLTAAVANETAAALLALSSNADAVLLTCSTLGPAVDLAAGETTVPIVRADGAVAAEAAKASGLVVVLCAIEGMVEPTQQLFAAAARDTEARPVARLVPGVWELFKDGDAEGYLSAIAAAADAAYLGGAALVVLGQASMADAAGLVSQGPKPLSTPAAGLAAALASARSSKSATSPETWRNPV
jgi:hypothetical protein